MTKVKMALLSTALLLVPAARALAECLPFETQLIEAKVVGCEAPDTHARQAFEELVRDLGLGEEWSDAESALQERLEQQPARLLKVHLIRARAAKDGSRWSPFDRPEALEALFLGSNDCADFELGATRIFEDLGACECPDPTSLTYLLGQVDFREPSKELLERAGTAEGETSGKGNKPAAAANL